MKLDELRRRYKPGAEAERVTRPARRVVEAEPEAPPFTEAQLQSALSLDPLDVQWVWNSFQLRDFVGGGEDLAQEVSLTAARIGWTDAVIDFVSDEDMQQGARLFVATIKRPVEGHPNHRQYCRLSYVKQVGFPTHVVRLGIPEPCAGRLARPKSKMPTSMAAAVLREAVRSFGWPVDTKAIILTQPERQDAKAKGHGHLSIALLDRHGPTGALHTRAKAWYNGAEHMMHVPVYPDVAMSIEHSIFVEMAAE